MTTVNETAAPVPAPARPRRKRRVFLWVFLAIQVAFLAWLIAGTASTGSGIHASAVAECKTHPYMTYAQCVSLYGGAAKAGTAIGGALVVAAWVVTDFLTALTYGVYRLARRGAR